MERDPGRFRGRTEKPSQAGVVEAGLFLANEPGEASIPLAVFFGSGLLI